MLKLSATVRNGILDVHEPIDLPDNTTVTLTVTPEIDDKEKRERAWKAWKEMQAEFDKNPVKVGEKFIRDDLYDRN